jgi:pimeloyl-ACP methyl ester carboxylesterase
MNTQAIDHFFKSPDGLDLYCRVYPADGPKGPPVLCLPGLTRNSRDFASLARHLQPGREVMTADLRGRGRSAWDKDPTHYQLAYYVKDVCALLASRSVARFLIVGTSLGALMAMTLAAMQPDKIAGIVLNDAGPELDPAGLRRIAGYAGKLPPVSSWDEAAAQTKSVYGAATPGLSDTDWLEYARRGYRENADGIPIPDVDPKISEAFKAPTGPAPDMWPLYAQIKPVPMLVIRGALSDILSASTVARMVREKPDLRHITVANRGHTPLLDEPECVAAIDEFLERYGGA